MARDYAKKAEEAVGNWQKFESFAWFDRPPDEENCAIIPYVHRDSDLMTCSNASVVEKEVEDLPDAWIEQASHWAVGWIAQVVVRVYDGEGEITESFKRVCDLFWAIEDYPVLDDEDLSRREYEAAIENIEDELGNMGLDKAFASAVYDWLSHNNQMALEDVDGHGAYPSEGSIAAAMHDMLGDFIHVPDTVITELGGRIVKRDVNGEQHASYIYPDALGEVFDYLGV